jgi:hypothetical protein
MLLSKELGVIKTRMILQVLPIVALCIAASPKGSIGIDR